MIRTPVLYRPAGLALSLLVLSIAGGCAHFRNAEVRAQERAGIQRAQPPLAEAVPPPPAAPEPPLPPPPAPPAPIPAAVPPAPNPAPEVAAQAMSVPAAPVSTPAEPITPIVPAPRKPVPAPSRAPAPATDNAIIIFANTPVAQCGACETLKISVAPSGQVLIERGSWTAGHSNWRYKRSRADVGPDRAAAFASSLSADRPAGAQTVGSANCAAPATGDAGLSIEWIEADRDDRLTVNFGCSAAAQVDRLRHAPDLLGLRQLAFP